jgi:hypothetical protein
LRLPPSAGSIDGMATTAAPARAPARRTIALLIGAAALGLALSALLRGHLATLEARAITAPIAARAQLAVEFRLGGLALFAIILALGASLVVASQRAQREERFPPTGAWGFGATRVITGPPARRAAQVGMVLAIALMACALAGARLSWEIGTRLLACRAGVPPVGP